MNFNLESVIVINNGFNLSIIKTLFKLFYLHCFYKKVVEKSNKDLPDKSGNPHQY